jgi:hypothetical protein
MPDELVAVSGQVSVRVRVVGIDRRLPSKETSIEVTNGRVPSVDFRHRPDLLVATGYATGLTDYRCLVVSSLKVS